MRRSTVLALRNEKWLPISEVLDDSGERICDLEVCVIPSAGTTMPGIRQGALDERQKLAICASVFTNFRNYEDDDGKPIPNSLEARLELLEMSAVFYAVQAHVLEAQGAVIQGEAVAVSV